VTEKYIQANGYSLSTKKNHIWVSFRKCTNSTARKSLYCFRSDCTHNTQHGLDPRLSADCKKTDWLQTQAADWFSPVYREQHKHRWNTVRVRSPIRPQRQYFRENWRTVGRRTSSEATTPVLSGRLADLQGRVLSSTNRTMRLGVSNVIRRADVHSTSFCVCVGRYELIPCPWVLPIYRWTSYRNPGNGTLCTT
jgi:hypothetical protein